MISELLSDLLEKTLSAMACPRMARKTGAHGMGCDGLCDKGEPGFLHPW
jgi:hypothetical protein